MSIFPKRDVPVDLDQLERDVTHQLRGAAAQEFGQVNSPPPAEYVPRKRAEPEAAGFAQQTPLQIIAQAIIRLTWKDAEQMGTAIAANLGDAKDIHNLTTAIQKWAEGWESFDVQA